MQATAARIARILASSLLLGAAAGFSPAHFGAPRCTGARAIGARPVMQEMGQELEFIIHPDGRVEERVRGVKGVECQSLTEEINKALGEVYESKPTQEMYEQKIEISVEAENTVSESWSGSSTWGSDGGDGGGSQW